MIKEVNVVLKDGRYYPEKCNHGNVCIRDIRDVKKDCPNLKGCKIFGLTVIWVRCEIPNSVRFIRDKE